MFNFYKTNKQINAGECHIIVQMLADGNGAKDIATFLCLSQRTVENKIQKILNVHHANSQGHLIAMFFRAGEIK